MRVYIIRHGESENNLKKCWTGWADAPLTPRGEEDARRAGTVLSSVKFDKVYSSDLSRAVNTAKIAIPGCEPETSALVREINVGNIAGKPLSVVTDEQRAVLFNEGYGMFGGEGKEEFYGRVRAFRDSLCDGAHSTVAVFAHAGWLRAFLDTVVGVTLSRRNILCDNCTVAVFEYVDGIWKLHSWMNFT